MKKIYFLPLLLLLSFSTNTIEKKASAVTYSEYNKLVEDIPSTQKLIDLNKKMDELKFKVDSLQNNVK